VSDGLSGRLHHGAELIKPKSLRKILRNFPAIVVKVTLTIAYPHSMKNSMNKEGKYYVD